MIHWNTHPELVDGCFGCKIAGVSFSSIPGGTRPGSARASMERQWKRDLDSYARARKAGETPDASTEKGVRRARMRQESLERVQPRIVEDD